MTAEIAVINKSAIALAADSAVTISNGTSSKIYNGAEKLFALTKYHPVGIMVYGTGNLCSIPWELIIKQYRKKLGRKCFDTLDAYAEDFWSFLCSEKAIIPHEYRETSIKSIYIQTFDLLHTLIDREGVIYVEDKNVTPDEQETVNIIDKCCDYLVSLFDKGQFFTGFDEQDLTSSLEPCLQIAAELIKSKFGDVDLPSHIIQKIGNIFSLVTCKQTNIGGNTGVVFAGYGDKEYFPSVLAFNVHCFVNDKLRYLPDLARSSMAGQSGLRAYAQEDEVVTFMTGINPYLQGYINDIYKSVVDNVLGRISDIIDKSDSTDTEKGSIKQGLMDSINNEWNLAQQSIEDTKRSEHIDKVLEMIEFLPKEDLAYMAESLVNMTAFKRKISNESETVGGPIDVAIISKGDGFIWVKRKHYFDKSLNNHYFANFL